VLRPEGGLPLCGEGEGPGLARQQRLVRVDLVLLLVEAVFSPKWKPARGIGWEERQHRLQRLQRQQ